MAARMFTTKSGTKSPKGSILISSGLLKIEEEKQNLLSFKSSFYKSQKNKTVSLMLIFPQSRDGLSYKKGWYKTTVY